MDGEKKVLSIYVHVICIFINVPSSLADTVVARMELILFLLKGEEPSFCVSSDEPLSLEHNYLAFLFGSDWYQGKHFNVYSLKVFFN